MVTGSFFAGRGILSLGSLNCMTPSEGEAGRIRRFVISACPRDNCASRNAFIFFAMP
jgi:hypothetical protein